MAIVLDSFYKDGNGYEMTFRLTDGTWTLGKFAEPVKALIAARDDGTRVLLDENAFHALVSTAMVGKPKARELVLPGTLAPRIVHVLRWVEWHGPGELCPMCQGDQWKDGHATTCGLAAVLRDLVSGKEEEP